MFGIGMFSANGDPGYPGLVVNDRVIDLRPHFGPDAVTATLLENWDASIEQLRAIADGGVGDAPMLTSLRPLAPIQPSGQIFCAGGNYHKHVTAMVVAGWKADPTETRSDQELETAAVEFVERHKANGKPFVFTLPPSALTGALDDVVLWGPGVQHTWELELAVVIGRRARNVSPEEALDYVAGYTISNDVSTLELMSRPNFPLTDFLSAKGRPTFLPTGPYVVPREFVPDYRELKIVLKTNGETKQDELVDDIIYGVEELVAFLSGVTELRPGDLILTGSPAGSAGEQRTGWLEAGDLMEGEITGLGVQRNRCVSDPRDTSDNG